LKLSLSSALLFVVLQGTASLTDDIPYRRLTWRTQGGQGNGGYQISVDRFLDRPAIEKLICQVLRKEQYVPSPMLGVSIFYKLEKLVMTLDGRELDNHTLAYYMWNEKLPNVQVRLWVNRDAQGNVFDVPRAYQFDHTQACDASK